MSKATQARVMKQAREAGRLAALRRTELLRQQVARRKNLTTLGKKLANQQKALIDVTDVSESLSDMKPHFREAWLAGYREIVPDAK